MSTSIINKVNNTITAHPKLVTFGIGLAVTFGVTIALGFANPEQAFAGGGACGTCRLNN